MPELRIPTGETKEVVPASDPARAYDFELSNNGLRFARRKADAPEGKPATAGDRGTIGPVAENEAVYAYNDDRQGNGLTAVLDIDRAGFALSFEPRASVASLDTISGTVAVQEDTPLDVSATTVPVQVTGTVDASAATVPTAAANQGVVDFGQDTTAASGTAEPLNGGTALAVPDGAVVWVKALPTNSAAVYVGDSNVTTGTGYPLEAGDPVPVGETDVSNIYVDVDTGGEGVGWVVT